MFSLICTLNKRLSKQSWGWWFETPSRSLWRHCNASTFQHQFDPIYKNREMIHTNVRRHLRFLIEYTTGKHISYGACIIVNIHQYSNFQLTSFTGKISVFHNGETEYKATQLATTSPFMRILSNSCLSDHAYNHGLYDRMEYFFTFLYSLYWALCLNLKKVKKKMTLVKIEIPFAYLHVNVIWKVFKTVKSLTTGLLYIFVSVPYKRNNASKQAVWSYWTIPSV